MRKINIKNAKNYIALKTQILNDDLDPEAKHTPLSFFANNHEKIFDLLKDAFAKNTTFDINFTFDDLMMSLADDEINKSIQNSPFLNSLNERGLITTAVKKRIGHSYYEISFKEGLSFSNVRIRCRPECFILSANFEDYQLMIFDKLQDEDEFISQSGITRKGFSRFFRDVENHLTSIQEQTKFYR